jgi:peptide-methionine (R)-S-oxide reductase
MSQESTDLPQSDEEWREVLTDDEYHVLREQGTEPRFSSDLIEYKGEGAFTCAGCGTKLFDADVKFDSRTGWPSFYDAEEGAVELREDRSHGMVRTEVVCATCGGHLGHVFDDGPDPTGKRYCINGAALDVDESES